MEINHNIDKRGIKWTSLPLHVYNLKIVYYTIASVIMFHRYYTDQQINKKVQAVKLIICQLIVLVDKEQYLHLIDIM